MTNREFIEQASIESNDLAIKIDALVTKYIEESRMPKKQRIVNVGRALNAYHAQWIGNLAAQVDEHTKKIQEQS